MIFLSVGKKTKPFLLSLSAGFICIGWDICGNTLMLCNMFCALNASFRWQNVTKQQPEISFNHYFIIAWRENVPLLWFVCFSFKTLSWWIGPNSSNNSRHSASSQWRGICPTNILMASWSAFNSIPIQITKKSEKLETKQKNFYCYYF